MTTNWTLKSILKRTEWPYKNISGRTRLSELTNLPSGRGAATKIKPPRENLIIVGKNQLTTKMQKILFPEIKRNPRLVKLKHPSLNLKYLLKLKSLRLSRPRRSPRQVKESKLAKTKRAKKHQFKL